jgi:hypothetical protein
MEKKTSKSSGSKKAVIGLSLAALAAAAAGTYFLYGTKKGAASRKKIKGWMLKAKGEILEKMESLKEINEQVYNKIVEEVKAGYLKAKKIDAKDMEEFVKEMKKHWKGIKTEIQKRTQPKKAKAKK